MHIVITGASRGIGAALRAQYLAQGHQVTGTSRSGDKDLIQLDVTDPAAHARLAQTLKDQPVDLLICNAGIYADKGQSLDDGYPAALWADTFATNVTGVFLGAQALLPNLARAQMPKIAIISSQMASDTRAPGGSYIYRASKAAALNLGRNLSADLAPRGIAVGIYHPGWVQTDMGGAGADITVDQSATGLAARFDALGLDTTGCFETWDGRAHPY
ncbi:MAG: SDR family NAD(P)-dependent oxidoreductase [Paracoccaceae bacterium]|nr:SDR family NAD(P)-dependent oxidoreductase [Paracoccaceae bacterium]